MKYFSESRFLYIVSSRYKETWLDRHFRFSFPAVLLFFAASVLANTYAGLYANEKASNAVTDIVLSNIPVFDVDLLFIWGAVALTFFIISLCLIHPRYAPFILESLGLFLFVRAFFVMMTHLGPYPDHDVLETNSKILLTLLGGGDQFFSGHTGIPFLMALVFWHKPRLRYLFLTLSVFFGIVVLLGHVHYTIDVLSAFFITYGIYQAALYFFPRERARFFMEELTT